MREELKWQKIPVLNDGFVCLVDVMGDDAAVVQAARTSYGAGTKAVLDDRGLLRYLMRLRHSTPFEMVELKFLVRVPMDTWRQWVRHRTASINEYSTRYSEAIDSQQVTAPDEWRLQTKTNKQGSDGILETWPEGWHWEFNAEDTDHNRLTGPDGREFNELPLICETPGGFLSWMELLHQSASTVVYDSRLELGVAREQARKDLPLSTYTEAYWKIDLHNLLHFLQLRLDDHAQLEIRKYAQALSEIVKQLVPLTWEAFEDYRLNALYLSGPEQQALRQLLEGVPVTPTFLEHITEHITNKREKRDAIAKLTSLLN